MLGHSGGDLIRIAAQLALALGAIISWWALAPVFARGTTANAVRLIESELAVYAFNPV